MTLPDSWTCGAEERPARTVTGRAAKTTYRRSAASSTATTSATSATPVPAPSTAVPTSSGSTRASAELATPATKAQDGVTVWLPSRAMASCYARPSPMEVYGVPVKRA